MHVDMKDNAAVRIAQHTGKWYTRDLGDTHEHGFYSLGNETVFDILFCTFCNIFILKTH